MLEYLVARAMIEERMRESMKHSQAREFRRGEKPAPAAPDREPRHHSRLWNLVHLRHRTAGAASGL